MRPEPQPAAYSPPTLSAGTDQRIIEHGEQLPRFQQASGSVALDFRDLTTPFRPAKAGNLRSDRHAFDLSRRQIRDVTKIHKFEAIFSDEAGAASTEPRDRFLLLPDNVQNPVATPKRFPWVKPACSMGTMLYERSRNWAEC